MLVDFVGDDAPRRSHVGDAGSDLVACEDVLLRAGERCLVGTGVCVGIPVGMVGMVCPRSGLALKHGVTVLNAPGIVDAGYTGEVGVILFNSSNVDYQVRAGDKVAQLVITPFVVPEWRSVDVLGESDRAGGGFGSTGS